MTRGDIAHLVKTVEWLPTIVFDGEETHQSSIYTDGTLNESPQIQAAVRALGQATDALGRMGTGDAARGQRDSELTGLWIEFKSAGPGLERRQQRELMDLIGPAHRAADGSPQDVTLAEIDEEAAQARTLGLLTQTSIVALPARLTEPYRTGLGLQAIAQNREAMVRMLLAADALGQNPPEVSDGESAEELTRVEAALGEFQEQPNDLYTAESLRWALNRYADHVYIDRPQILATHVTVRPMAEDSDELYVLRALDLVETGVAVRDEAPVASRRVRLEQGVADAVAESEAMESDSPANAAVAMARGDGWSGHREAASLPQELPADAAARMAQSVSHGSLVVAPAGSMADAAGRMQTSWWTIDPQTGDTLATGGQGWGMSPMTEYTAKMQAFLRVLVLAWKIDKGTVMRAFAIKLVCWLVVATAKLMVSSAVNAVAGKEHGTLAHYVNEILNSLGMDAVMGALGAACLKL